MGQGVEKYPPVNPRPVDIPNFDDHQSLLILFYFW
jgi:hypothetical protein